MARSCREAYLRVLGRANYLNIPGEICTFLKTGYLNNLVE